MSQPSAEGTTPVENPGQEVHTDNVPEPKDDVSTSTLSHEDALKELQKVRREAAEKRVKNKELEERARKWEQYEESQKSELQKLQEAVAERDKRIAETELEVTRARIAHEFNVADEDLDLLVGDEDNMKRLASRLGKKQEETRQRPADLLAGNRGTAVGTSGNNFSMDDFIRGSIR